MPDAMRTPPDIARLQARSEDAEQDLRDALHSLEQTVRSRVDPSTLVHGHELALVAGLFTLGLALGLRRSH